MNIECYRKLFVHRDDVFAEQQSSGAYFPVKRHLDDMDIEEHLGGLASYGVYVIDPAEVPTGGEGLTANGNRVGELVPNTVKYAVFDLDTYDEEALDFLTNSVETLVATTTNDLDFNCLMLESSGGKGFHIWLFFDEPVEAARVRAWTEPVREAYDSMRPRGADAGPETVWPALEIFPKQDTVAEGGYGNLVKLPFGVHAKTGKRSEIVGYQGWANDVSSVQGLNASLLPHVQRKEAVRSESRTAPFACISKIIEEGVGSGNRDNAMFHFARYACGTGLPDDLVEDWCERVNEGFDPPLTDAEVETKVRSASAMASPHPGCKADWLKGFCPGGEHCYAPWNDRGPRKGDDGVGDMDSALARIRARRLRGKQQP